MFLRKTHVSPPPARSSVRAVEGRQRTRYDRFETEAFIKVRRTCTYIWTSIRAIILWSLKALGHRVLALLSGKSFYSSGHRDLDLWSTNPKSIVFFYSIRAIILWSFKAHGLRVLELLSGKYFSLFGSLWPWPLTYWPQNQTGSSTQKEQSPYEDWRLWRKGYSSY